MKEELKQQMKDSDMIFTQITTSSFDNWEEVKHLIVTLYIPDMTISRAGISHAMNRLERHFKTDT